MKTVKIKLYLFEELSERAQENAIGNYRHHYCKNYWWSNETIAGWIRAGGKYYLRDGRSWDTTLEEF